LKLHFISTIRYGGVLEAEFGLDLQVFSACMILSNLELLTSRMDEVALVGSSPHGSSKIVNFEGMRRLALKHIEDFVLSMHRTECRTQTKTSIELSDNVLLRKIYAENDRQKGFPNRYMRYRIITRLVKFTINKIQFCCPNFEHKRNSSSTSIDGRISCSIKGHIPVTIKLISLF
jgi:hypothetical protein